MSMKNGVVRVVVEGDLVRFIHTDKLATELSKCGRTKTRRASHVEPYGDGFWQADMRPVRGPVLDGFKTRESALRAELEWLDAAGY